MIFLVLITYNARHTIVAIELAVCEDAGPVVAYEARGYRQVNHAAFRKYWRLRDLLALRAMRDALPAQERAVGEPDGWDIF